LSVAARFLLPMASTWPLLITSLEGPADEDLTIDQPS